MRLYRQPIQNRALALALHCFLATSRFGAAFGTGGSVRTTTNSCRVCVWGGGYSQRGDGAYGQSLRSLLNTHPCIRKELNVLGLTTPPLKNYAEELRELGP